MPTSSKTSFAAASSRGRGTQPTGAVSSISLTPSGEQWLKPLAKDVLNGLAVSGPDLLRTVRVAVTHAAASAARPQIQVRADIGNFAWRAVGPAPI